jgi:hypothetical protein
MIGGLDRCLVSAIGSATGNGRCVGGSGRPSATTGWITIRANQYHVMRAVNVGERNHTALHDKRRSIACEFKVTATIFGAHQPFPIDRQPA